MKTKEEGVVLKPEPKKIFFMNTEEIKEELGSWGEEYLKHRTDEQQYDCELLYGERQGIVEWLYRRGIIGYEAPDQGQVAIGYYFVKDLSAWKFFERKLELWRELEGRKHYAEVKERERQLGGNPREREEEIAGKVLAIKAQLHKFDKHSAI
jgi:hypothetical protein